jgi:hypothetical protein
LGGRCFRLPRGPKTLARGRTWHSLWVEAGVFACRVRPKTLARGRTWHSLWVEAGVFACRAGPKTLARGRTWHSFLPHGQKMNGRRERIAKTGFGLFSSSVSVRCRYRPSDRAFGPPKRPCRAFCRTSNLVSAEKNGRRERIRTSGPYVPNVVLYQAELLSVTMCERRAPRLGRRPYSHAPPPPQPGKNARPCGHLGGVCGPVRLVYTVPACWGVAKW